MNDRFHDNVPSWIIRYMKGQFCNKCSAAFNKKGIIAVGLRKKDSGASPYIEHECHNCGYRQILRFGHIIDTIEKLCYSLLEGIKRRKRIANIQQEKQSTSKPNKMTEQEIDDFLQRLRQSKNYEDVLKEIGAIEIHRMLEKESKKKENES